MHRNSFDLLRLALATAVIVGHSWGMLGFEDPYLAAVHGPGIGETAVCGFFILSGYLVSASWRRAAGLGYFRNRLLRIAPGYAVAFVLSYFIIGALASPDPGAFWAAIDWPATGKFFASFHGPGNLPATFVGQAAPVTNGSLWTIQFEILCYMLTPLLVWRRWPTVALWVACIAFATLTADEGRPDALAFPRLLAMYCSGVLYADLQPALSRWRLIWVAGLTAVAMAFAGTWEFGLATGGACLLLGLGRLRSPIRFPDFSYGTYLYAWPIQNLLIRAGVTSPIVLLLLAIPLAWSAGVVSWFGVEKQALRLKTRAEGPGAIEARAQPTGYIAP